MLFIDYLPPHERLLYTLNARGNRARFFSGSGETLQRYGGEADLMNIQAENDPLLKGFYTVSDAARLLGMKNHQHLIRSWLRPGKSGSDPVVRRDFPPTHRTQVLSFLDLVEVRFVENFRSRGKGVSLQYLRKVAKKAREELSVRHPFALSHVYYQTDLKKIFQDVARGETRQFSEMLSGQYEMYDLIEKTLVKDLRFCPDKFIAIEWFPLKEHYPNVRVNPRFAFGQPVIGQSNVPTAAIYRQYKAENENRERVAEWWKINLSEVNEAIGFEDKTA